MAKKGLGRGLGALLNTEEVVDTVFDKKDIVELKITEIEPNANQPRNYFDAEKLAALSESIKEYGVLQPIVVKQLETGFYKIIAGERRWRAARMAGMKKIPVIIKEYDNKETMEIALIENLQRENLNPIEEAMGFRELMNDFGLTQEELSKKVGKSRPAIANSLRLLNLPNEIQQLLIEGKLSPGHARAILGTDRKEIQLEAAKKIIDEGLNVRQIEKYIASLQIQPTIDKEEKEDIEKKRYFRSLENSLSNTLGTKVKIMPQKNNKGKIQIDYYSNEEFERLLEIIKN